MDGKEAIIAKILSDAEKRSHDNEHAASTYAVSVKEAAEEWAKDYSAEQEKVLAKDAEDIVSRRKIVAALDVRKTLLKAKQEVLDDIYARAEKKLCAVDKKTYTALVLKLIGENADDGDEMILSCDGVIKETDLTESQVFQSKRLKISKTRGDFTGGVILSGKICDKNLTFHELILAEKERTSSVLAKKLFG